LDKMDLSPHSEASKLLEAALEQMDGIIQGAKFEMPAYFDDANGNARGVGNGKDVSPAAVAVTAPSPKPPRFGLSSPLPATTVPEALDQLKLAILNDKNSFESRDVMGELSLRPHLDGDTVTFLSRWLKNNPYPKSGGGSGGGGGIRGNNFDDEGDQMAIEERLLHAESERDALGLQVSILGEQVGRQTSRLQDMEQLLAAKKELLRKTEMALDRERTARTAMEESKGHLGELTRLRKRCSELERENEELRKICTGNRTPRLLNLSPTMGSPPLSNRDALDLGSSSPENEVLKKGVGFGEAEIIYDGPAAADPSPSGRPPRGLKKILGKIKRSNSGGQLEGDTLKRSTAAANGNPVKSEFRRGGFRSTAGGRLGGWNSQGAMSSTAAARRDLARRPVSEWNVDMICTWLDCLGLGMYSAEVQKTIGTGEDLAKMTLGGLENKLNVKNGMHRKKLFLALAARNDSSRPDAEGRLDFQWVLRWLDDIGLPQYKDAFAEARVDGRVLNVLTADDLFVLKVTNLLHHLSIRRGIQVVRARNFDPQCLKRRAAPGETLDPASVSLWTNHRVMEWLKQVDLAEYAPNLRGSGVHGGLLVLEPRFGDELLATLLSIPTGKTLLRRHLSIHFKDLVGKDVVGEKRGAEQDSSSAALTPTAKAKPRQMGQFTLKRKKSKSQMDYSDLVCPFAQT